MATKFSPVSRQPDKLDYASPTQFRFGIHQLPKVEFFGTSVNLPAISLPVANYPTPMKNIPLHGSTVEYENLTLQFIVDEYLENFISLHNWIVGAGFPKDRSQFTNFRDVTSNTPEEKRGSLTDIGVVDPPTPDSAMFSDANLMILSNKNNPIVQVDFKDLFPISLGELEYNQNAADVEYIQVSAEFTYTLYEFRTL